jgi:cysteine synthase A
VKDEPVAPSVTAIPWARYGRALDSIAEAVGRTPVVRLHRVVNDVGPPIFAKLEWYGPSGSLKDRIYLHMFNRAEGRGELRLGQHVLECSTGNAGIACAFVAAVKGYRCTIVMPEGMSEERKKLITAFGGDLVLTPGGESDVDLALAKLEEIRSIKPERYWVPGQFDNADNVEAHYLTTGPEIWEQVGVEVDALVASQGSGGAISGVGRYLREQRPEIRVYAVEPDECAALARSEWGTHGIEGIGDGFVPNNLDLGLLSGVITVTTQESIAMARRLAREEGIFCGISSGANVAAAIKLAKAHPDRRGIVVLINDTGQRYFSTELFGGARAEESPSPRRPIDARSQERIEPLRAGWELIS